MDQFLGLEGNLPRLRARETLKEVQRAGVRLDPEEYLDLLRAALEDEDAAQEAATRYAADLLRSGSNPK